VVTVSVVIPVLNEEAAIGPALASTEGAHEVIVVDGGSSDATCEIVRATGHRLLESARGRGVQLNLGAATAAGDVLLFLHADTQLPDNFARDVVSCLTAHDADWGRFDLRFDAGGPLLRLIARLICRRSRLTKVATGDQAIFVRRDLFEELGGFRERELFEDIDLCRRLKRGRRMVIPVRPVITSSRRWREDGAVRTSLRMWALKLAYLAGVSSERLARVYRDVR
jgi:rSAM/selenodomain-associated transferase 2